MYGSRVDEEGKEIQGDSSFVQAKAGERVAGVKLASIGLATDREGNTIENRANIIFEQEGGAKVFVTLFEATEDWQFKAINTKIKHIATKLMTEEEYYTALNAGGSPGGFGEFIAKISSIFMPLAEGKVFTMKFVYLKGYLTVPNFPNWMALPGNEDTLSTNPKFDKYVNEEPTENVPAGGVPSTDQPF
tara:strand:- start:187 stop:753 length:567 start_codon:yes stop_codon:yes gene_type:complete